MTALHVETDKIAVNAKPTEEELQTYYEAYNGQFIKKDIPVPKIVLFRLIPLIF